MLEVLFHAGAEHPDMTWIAIAAGLSFFGGLLAGRFVWGGEFAGSIRDALRS